MIRNKKQSWLCIISAALLALGLTMPTTSPLAKSGGNPGVIPPDAEAYGKSYQEWSAKWWQWGLELPVDGHPFSGCPDSLGAGQSGPVWFLAGGPVECSGTLPPGKALFFPLVNAECSSLEEDLFHGDTEAEQRTCAKFWADHIVESSLFCEIDGVPVTNLTSYRVDSPHFKFKAPTPWVFGLVGGKGTAVGDGYYILLDRLSKGTHTIHFGGYSHFAISEGDPFDADFGIDTTFHLTVGH